MLGKLIVALLGVLLGVLLWGSIKALSCEVRRDIFPGLKQLLLILLVVPYGFLIVVLLEAPVITLLVFMPVALLVFMLAVLINVFRQTVQEKSLPNQGIWNSAKNSLLVTVLSTVFILLIQVSLTPLVMPFFEQSDVEGAIILLSAVPILIGFLLGGGQAVIDHVALRTTLFLQGHSPRNYAHFLDYATERLLVQRVGGGYIFVHRLLLEHFAALGSQG